MRYCNVIALCDIGFVWKKYVLICSSIQYSRRRHCLYRIDTKRPAKFDEFHLQSKTTEDPCRFKNRESSYIKIRKTSSQSVSIQVSDSTQFNQYKTCIDREYSTLRVNSNPHLVRGQFIFQIGCGMYVHACHSNVIFLVIFTTKRTDEYRLIWKGLLYGNIILFVLGCIRPGKNLTLADSLLSVNFPIRASI